MENIVPQHKTNTILTDKFFPNNKSLRKAIG